VADIDFGIVAVQMLVEAVARFVEQTLVEDRRELVEVPSTAVAVSAVSVVPLAM
jgi:hypothetical protein